MTDCPKFAKMHKMFHGKYVIVGKVQPIAKTQAVVTDVNVVDVNATIRNKITEK
jgi:hypothetical protein